MVSNGDLLVLFAFVRVVEGGVVALDVLEIDDVEEHFVFAFGMHHFGTHFVVVLNLHLLVDDCDSNGEHVHHSLVKVRAS